MATINPYLTFHGNCEEAFNYYKSVFGGEFSSLNRFSEMPAQEGMTIPKASRDKIMHISLPISEAIILMGCDTGGEWATDTIIGNNITLAITADSKDQADQFFKSLSDGGKKTMPMDKTFWGEYFGMCSDKFDIHWMISFRENEKE